MTTEIEKELETSEAVLEKRRNFAIISHPDAGKTTLTEKLLLYGGAIHQAGAVKARRRPTQSHLRLDGNGKTTGNFDYFHGFTVRIIVIFRLISSILPDTKILAKIPIVPYTAADNAVMLIGRGKGLEPRNQKTL
jgi:peptide chain release factor 3